MLLQMMMECSSEEDEIRLPQKRPRTNCIIDCCNEDIDSKLVSPTNFESWVMLLRAAEVRSYDPILDINKGLTKGEIPDVQYHRKCCSIFTMKKLSTPLLSRTSTKKVYNTLLESHPDTHPAHQGYMRMCSKYQKGKRTRESLVQ